MHVTLLPDGWPRPKGYANGILAEGTKHIFCGGQIGWNADGVFETNDFVGQLRQALLNVRAVLDCADVGPEHMTRMTWYITDRQAYLNQLPDIGQTYRDVMGKNFPAMSVVEVSALIEAEAMIEIEVTAIA